MNRRFLRQLPAWFLLTGIRVYQVTLAPLMPFGCKFDPTCSRYAAEAIARHGALRGSRLAIGRILRCRPFTRGGPDPVPEPDDLRDNPRHDSGKPETFS